MNAYQEAVLSMAQGVKDICERFEYQISRDESFSIEYLKFLNLLDKAGRIEDQKHLWQQEPRRIKRIKRDILEAAGYLISNRLQIVAIQNSDQTLLEQVSFKLSQFTRASERDLLRICRRICEASQSAVNDLHRYEVNPHLLSELHDALEDFENLLDIPHIQEAEQKAQKEMDKATNELVQQLEEQIDQKVFALREDEPDFLRLYQEARKINPPHLTLAMRVKVMDTATLLPIPNVEALIAPLKLRSKSSDEGVLEIEKIRPDVYEVTFRKTGYRTLTIPINITGDKASEMNVKMQPRQRPAAKG